MLTDEQCHAFRILPVSFNDMVRAIFEAGRDAQRESDAKICVDVQQQRVDGAKDEYCAGREMAAEVICNKIRANKGE